MGGLTLLEEAAAAGLTVVAEGDRLIIDGPPTAEPVALRLLAAKPEIMAAQRGAPPILTPAAKPEITAALAAPPPIITPATQLAVSQDPALDPDIARGEATKYSRSAIVVRLARLRARAAQPGATALDQALVADWQAILAVK